MLNFFDDDEYLNPGLFIVCIRAMSIFCSLISCLRKGNFSIVYYILAAATRVPGRGYVGDTGLSKQYCDRTGTYITAHAVGADKHLSLGDLGGSSKPHVLGIYAGTGQTTRLRVLPQISRDVKSSNNGL